MNPWKILENDCRSCSRCALADTRTQVVFGTGNPQAQVLVVGEAPGEKEDLSGEPFVGRGGKLLDELLNVIDLSRHSNIYIANMVKCRPPQNRDPLQVERRACSTFLQRQIQLMAPKIIVCMGRVAATSLIDKNFKITQEHGLFFEVEGSERMALFHPAAILRNPHYKPATFLDLKALQEKIREIAPETYE